MGTSGVDTGSSYEKFKALNKFQDGEKERNKFKMSWLANKPHETQIPNGFISGRWSQ